MQYWWISVREESYNGPYDTEKGAIIAAEERCTRFDKGDILILRALKQCKTVKTQWEKV